MKRVWLCGIALMVTGSVQAEVPAVLRYIVIEADANWQIAGSVTRNVVGERSYNSALGRLAVIYERPVGRLDLRLGIEHRSIIAAGDRGEELVTAGVRWRPFGR